MTSHIESRLRVEGRPYYGRCVNRVTPVTRARGARSWAARFGSRCNSTWAPGTFRCAAAFFTVQSFCKEIMQLSVMQVKGEQYVGVTALTPFHGRAGGALDRAQRRCGPSGARVVQFRWRL